MSPVVLRKFVGILTTCLGVWFLSFMVPVAFSLGWPVPVECWLEVLMFASGLMTLIPGLIALVCGVQLWIVLSGFFKEFSPMEEGYSQVPEFPWVIMGLLIPILVAGIFYSIASSKLALRAVEIPISSRACASRALCAVI
jgi:xanthine/uracil permease